MPLMFHMTFFKKPNSFRAMFLFMIDNFKADYVAKFTSKLLQ